MVINSARVSAFGQRWTARIQQSRAMMAGSPGLATIGRGARKDCGAATLEPGDQASIGGRRVQAEHAGDQLQVPLLLREPTEPPVPNDPITVIGAGLTITGKLEFKGEVQVEGEVQGDIHAQRIFIGEQARIRGALIAEEIVVRGNVQGSIHGNAVIFQSSCQAKADVVHKSLAIEQGALFEGRSIRSEDPMSLLRTALKQKYASNSAYLAVIGAKRGGSVAIVWSLAGACSRCRRPMNLWQFETACRCLGGPRHAEAGGRGRN
jgi:cytoskeletal protein CcmA (bactofilin family)